MLEAISPALEAIRTALGPWYLYIKFVHLISVMIWAWSTAVAYGWYVRLTYRKWLANPGDEERKRRRNWALEQFDRGAIMEHVAFPLVVVTGPLLWIIGGWRIDVEPSWLLVKLVVVVGIFLPMEIVDYWLCHFWGNKYRIRLTGDLERYERVVGLHWLFLRITTPLVIVFVPLVIFLVVVKPF